MEGSLTDDEHADASAARPKPTRKYAFACEPCRRKKMRCDGGTPMCKRCRQAGNNECHYPYSASAAKLKQAHQRIRELETALLHQRQDVVPTSADCDGSSPQAVAPSLDKGLNSTVADDGVSPHIARDENGTITYHGPTSRFHAETVTDSSCESAAALRDSLYRSHAQAFLNNNELMQQVWEPMIRMKTEQELGLPPALVSQLLDVYWTWQHPLHNCVYKPCFIMDMALGGPYYSKFLLLCILALAARHLGDDATELGGLQKGEALLGEARLLLANHLSDPRPQIPTIQGLLILAGRQCAVGKPSEGWLYTGMAVRMLSDLGLHLDLHHLARLERLTPADLELRKRLYCSAYVWDKTLSLSLGRSCSMRQLSPSALDMFDDSDNEDPWRPSQYPDYLGGSFYNTLCFQNFCRLGRLVDLIMVSGSLDGREHSVAQRLIFLESKLNEWFDTVPEVLKMVPNNDSCPPPHIFSLNLLYHTLHIILWRSYRHNDNVSQDLAARAREACVEKSKVVHGMFLLYGKQFNLMYMTYLISYCVYTAATVDVDEMKAAEKESREAAAMRLGVSLRILETEAKQTPGVRRSIDIIKRQLRTWGPNEAERARQDHVSRTSLNSLAFAGTYAQPSETRDSVGPGECSAIRFSTAGLHDSQQPAVQPSLAFTDQIMPRYFEPDDLQALFGTAQLQNFSEPFYVDTGGGFLQDSLYGDFGNALTFAHSDPGFGYGA